ncbi:SH3 domain-containing protein [Prauserella oleivorans]|uniref:SH3 domain-containing protein n=1 Tax=Prauserella oleivorans TaxID=1478153 RepID=A0ABW5WCV9_9PSEU
MVLGIPKRTLIILAVLVGVVVIYAIGSDQRSSGAEGSASGGCTVTVTADILNVRSAPSLQGEIVGKLEQDAETEATKVVQNGFRRIDENRWAADEFLEPVDGASCG